MRGALIVTCELCGKDWPEDDDGVRVAPFSGTIHCTDFEACSDRQIEQEQEDHR